MRVASAASMKHAIATAAADGLGEHADGKIAGCLRDAACFGCNGGKAAGSVCARLGPVGLAEFNRAESASNAIIRIRAWILGKISRKGRDRACGAPAAADGLSDHAVGIVARG